MRTDQDDLAPAAAAAGTAGEGKGALAAEVKGETTLLFVAQDAAVAPASVFGLNLEHGLLKHACSVPLDLDGCVHVVLQVFQDDSRKVGGVKELIPRVPFDLCLLPLDLVLPHLIRFLPPAEITLDLRAGFSFAVKEAERGAEGRGRPGELEDITPAEHFVFRVFPHRLIVVRSAGLVKFLGIRGGGYIPEAFIFCQLRFTKNIKIPKTAITHTQRFLFVIFPSFLTLFILPFLKEEKQSPQIYLLSHAIHYIFLLQLYNILKKSWMPEASFFEQDEKDDLKSNP